MRPNIKFDELDHSLFLQLAQDALKPFEEWSISEVVATDEFGNPIVSLVIRGRDEEGKVVERVYNLVVYRVA